MSRFNRFSLIVFAVLVLAVFPPRLLIDPYRVFGLTGFNARNFEPNTRYLKIEHLRRHCGDLDGYVLGTSRVNFYGTEAPERLFGGRFYNLSVSAETVPGMVARVDWLLANCPVHRVLVGLDFDWFGYEQREESDNLRREHYLLSGDSPLAFYASYLTVPFRSLRRTVSAQWRRDTEYHFDPVAGLVTTPARDRQMRAGPLPYWREFRPICYRPVVRMAAAAAPVARNLERLRQMAARLRESGVEATFVINPVNQNLAAQFDAVEFAAWSRAVAEATGGVWFLGGFHALTENDARWYEENHFDFRLGEDLLAMIAGRQPAPPPVGFYRAADAARLAAAVRANYDSRRQACGG